MRGFSEICDNTGSVESKQPVKYKRSLAGNVTKATKQNRQTEKQTYPSLLHDIILTTKYLKNCSSILEVGKRSHYFLVYILN